MEGIFKIEVPKIPGPNIIDKIELKEIYARKLKKNKSKNNNSHCRYCQQPFVGLQLQTLNHRRAKTVEHLVPLSMGGNNSEANKRFVCSECNNLRGNRTYDDFLKIIDYKIKSVISNEEKERLLTIKANIPYFKVYIAQKFKELTKWEAPITEKRIKQFHAVFCQNCGCELNKSASFDGTTVPGDALCVTKTYSKNDLRKLLTSLNLKRIICRKCAREQSKSFSPSELGEEVNIVSMLKTGIVVSCFLPIDKKEFPDYKSESNFTPSKKEAILKYI